MRSTLDEVLATLGHLETFVQSIGPVNDALASLTDPVVRGYLTVRRQLDSAAFIVVLYAAFEKFVEELLWSRTKLEAASARYDDLWEPLRKKHLERTASLLAKGYLGERRYADLSERAAIANLHQCISGHQPYELNQHAILHHESNLKLEVVQELFKLVGVPDIHELARSAVPLLEWNRRVNGLAEPDELALAKDESEEKEPESVQKETIKRRIEDVVTLRNRTAHTGVGAGEVLGASEMQEHLDFMRSYCRALYQVVAGDYLDQAYLRNPGASVALEKLSKRPIRQYVVVVRMPECRVYLGQPVIGKRANRVHRWGTIQEIQVDNRPVSEVKPAASIKEIGLKVDFELTRNTQLYLLPAKDDAVWP